MAHALASGARIGEYELLEVIGRGSLAIVHRARHVKTGQIHALKILISQASLEPTLIERFKREAQFIRDIDHPNVVRLVDFGATDKGQLYLVMEWVDGRQLSEILEKESPLSTQRAIAYTKGIARGLGAIHKLDFVHRDLKPQNIMITRAGSDGKEEVKLVDFGLVHADIAVWERLTRTGEIIGTPRYMAPEIIDGRAVDARTDLYALGVVLYEMLAGRPPFVADVLPDLLAMQIAEPPPRLVGRGGVENVAMRLLAKAPSDRPLDSHALIALLESLESGESGGGWDVSSSPTMLDSEANEQVRSMLEPEVALDTTSDPFRSESGKTQLFNPIEHFRPMPKELAGAEPAAREPARRLPSPSVKHELPVHELRPRPRPEIGARAGKAGSPADASRSHPAVERQSEEGVSPARSVRARPKPRRQREKSRVKRTRSILVAALVVIGLLIAVNVVRLTRQRPAATIDVPAQEPRIVSRPESVESGRTPEDETPQN